MSAVLASPTLLVAPSQCFERLQDGGPANCCSQAVAVSGPGCLQSSKSARYNAHVRHSMQTQTCYKQHCRGVCINNQAVEHCEHKLGVYAHREVVVPAFSQHQDLLTNHPAAPIQVGRLLLLLQCLNPFSCCNALVTMPPLHRLLDTLTCTCTHRKQLST